MFKTKKIVGVAALFAVVFITSCAKTKNVGTTYVLTGGLRGSQKIAFDETFFNGLSAKYSGDEKTAMVNFQQCLKLDPSNNPVKYELSQTYARMGNSEQALSLAEETVKSDPQNEWYLVNLAQAYQSAKMYAQAAEVYEKLIKMNPNELNYYYDLGTAYLYANNANSAISTYENLELLIGFDNSLAEQLFKLYEHQKMYVQAEAKLVQLVENNPTEVRYISMLASYYKKNGETQKAINLYEGLKTDYPNDPYVKLALYEYYSEIGQRNTAFENLEQAFQSKDVTIDAKVGILLALMDAASKDNEIKAEVYELLEIMTKVHPDDAKTWAIYGDYLNMNQEKEKARSMFLKSIALDSSKYEVWNQVLFLDTEINDQDGLFMHSQQCAELFPNQILPHYFMGVVYMQKKQYAEAVLQLDQARELAYGMPELEVQILGNLGDAYYQLGNFQKSWLAYDHALRIEPSNDYVLNNYAYFLSEQNEKLDEAEKMSKQTISRNPKSPTYLDTYGWILFKMENYAGAVKYLELAKQYSETPGGEILEHLGDAYFKSERTEDAVRMWEAAKIAGGGSDLLDQKIQNRKL